MSQYDTDSLYEFLKSTPEKGLRHMLVGAEFSEPHLNLLLKVVRSCNSDEFGQMFSSDQFPRIRMNEKESKIREKFWKDCEKVMLSRGLLYPAVKKSVKEAA